MTTKHWLFKPILFFVSIGSFLISWIFTCNLLASMATTGFATAIAFGLATVLEPAKIVFHAVGVINRDLFALVVGIVLTSMSIIGTLGWLQVQHAEKIAATTQQSAGFIALQSQISGLESQIGTIQTAAKGLPSNHHTNRRNMLSEANGLLDQKNDLTKKLSAYAPVTGSGSNALFVSLGSFFNQPSDLIGLWINATYGILLELVAVISGIYVFKSDDGVKFSADTVNHNNTSSYPQPLQAKQMKNVPMSSTEDKHGHMGIKYVDDDLEDDGTHLSTDISDIADVLPAYIGGLFQKTGKGGRLQGRRSVAAAIGISKGQADNCHNYIKKLGWIKVRGNASFAKMTQPEMLKQLTEGGQA